MAIAGETIGGTTTTCMGCSEKLKLEVLKSNRYYIGFFCPNCGPYSRESGYYPTRKSAEKALDSGEFGR